MPPVTLDGDTLGKKHRHYNKLIEDAITDEHYQLSELNGDNDIANLLKIDIASKTKNVDFILKVMKCDDLLYAAMAVKRSTWLITDPQYTNIINPEYLHTQLLPVMNSKIFNKLMLHIRLNLKDETRVETFYEYLKETDGALKWLQNCSIPFIENVLKNDHLRIPLDLYKRLCRRCPKLLTYYTRVADPRRFQYYNVESEILFMLKSHTSEVLNVIEGLEYIPLLNKKQTELLMKTNAQRVLDNFDKYGKAVNLPVLAKCLNQNEIKEFLCNNSEKMGSDFLNYNTLKHFIKRLLPDDRFELIKKSFIDKTQTTSIFTDDQIRCIQRDIKSYLWYELLPFDVAFFEMKKLIRKQSSASERCNMILVLLYCAENNQRDIKTLLKYIVERHINEPLKFKDRFLKKLLSSIPTHHSDVETWNLLDLLFHNVEVYNASAYTDKQFVQSIVLYKVIHDEEIPQVIEQKLTYDEFYDYIRPFQKSLNEEQNNKIFTYLLNTMLSKIQIDNIANESQLEDIVNHKLRSVLTLLTAWKKDLTSYPLIIKRIQEIVKLKQANNWGADTSGLYLFKKSWRKHMFEESLLMHAREDSCLNMLKHNPQLFLHYDYAIHWLRLDDNFSLRRLLSKLRIYWPDSLAQHWTNMYLQEINTAKESVFKGLFWLVSQKQIVELAIKHVPNDFKVNWSEIDETEINIRKNIAKNLHIARPRIPLDIVLRYAKGDYLQYAVPSLNATLSTMKKVDSREVALKLLEEPVSLQKFGINLIFCKLETEDLISLFSKTWKITKNLTIRSILFKYTYAQISTVKNTSFENKLWELLNTFMDDLKSGENVVIYKKLGNVRNIPVNRQADYFMKSYEILTLLPRSDNCERFVTDLIHYAPTIMELLDEDFVESKLLSPTRHTFSEHGYLLLDIIASYILCGKSEEDQVQRFRRVTNPAMQYLIDAAIQNSEKNTRSYYVVKHNGEFLKALVSYFKTYINTKKIHIPTKLFLEVKYTVEKELPLTENYILCTSWKLVTEYVKLIHEYVAKFKASESNKLAELDFADWRDVHFKISPSLGPVLVKCLKQDTEQYGLTIHSLFTVALKEMLCGILSFKEHDFLMETLKHMLNEDFIPSYIVVSNSLPLRCNNEMKIIRTEIRNKLKSHPSVTVRVHVYSDYWIDQED